MKTIQLTAHVAADGMLNIPINFPDFVDRDVNVLVFLSPAQEAEPSILTGQQAWQVAQEVGFIGSLEAEPEFSEKYKEHLDWSDKL